MSKYSFWALSFCAVFFSACEGDFVGDRELNSEVVNGPFEMKIRTVGGTDYLVLMNTNSQFQKKLGSIQFYSLANPRSPQLMTNPAPLAVPANGGSFEIIDDVLFFTNRTRDELWFYQYDGSAFVRMKDSRDNDLTLRVGANPVRLFRFDRNSDSKTILGLVQQRSGAISLMDPDTRQWIGPVTLGLTVANTDSVFLGNIPATKFYMKARQTTNDEKGLPKDDRIGVGGIRRAGYGVTDIAFLGGNEDVIAVANAFENALHIFQFATFKNTANFTWDLPRFREDYDISEGVTRKGTGSNGFRGIDVDDAGSVYLSNRADNSIYRMSSAEVLRGKDAEDRNTRGYDEHVQENRLPIDFDTDITDEVFPKLDKVTVDRTGAAATRLWVLGMGKNDAGNEGKVYRVDLNSNTLTHTQTLGFYPQRMLLHPASGTSAVLFVASNRSNRVDILEPDTLEVLGRIEN